MTFSSDSSDGQADAALLANALIREFPQYYRWCSQKEFTWNGITQQNRNGLLWRDPSVDGVKTGHTKSAGYCLVTSAKRGDMRLVSAVMGTDSMRTREDASAALLNYGFNFFESKRNYPAGQPLTTMRVWKGKLDEVGLTVGRDLYVTNQRGHVSSVKAEFELPETLVAPLAKYQRVGTAKVVVDGQTIATYDLFPTADGSSRAAPRRVHARPVIVGTGRLGPDGRHLYSTGCPTPRRARVHHHLATPAPSGTFPTTQKEA